MNKKFFTALALFGLSSIGLSSMPAMAQSKAGQKPTQAAGTFLLAKYGDWGVYVNGKDAGKVCYALSQPKERLPSGLTRDPAYLFISSRPSSGLRNEFALTMGYPLKPATEGSASVGTTQFVMLGKDKSAWLKNPAEEARLIDTMRKGNDLVVKGTSIKGNQTSDKYSLSGLNQALDRVQKECP